jgi:hypothetical protein
MIDFRASFFSTFDTGNSDAPVIKTLGDILIGSSIH